MSVNPNMATQLKKTTENVKKYAIYFIIFVVVVFIIDWATRGATVIPVPGDDPYYEGYPKPDNLFDKIPKPGISSIEATTGTRGIISKKTIAFPTFPPVGYIYKIKPEREYLNDAQLGKDVAKSLGFPDDYTVLQNVMNWTSEDSKKTLTFDRFQKYFKYSVSNIDLPTLSETEKDEIFDRGIKIFQSLRLKTTEMDEKASSVNLLFRSPQGNVTTNVSNYNCAQVLINKYIVASEAKTNDYPDTMAPVRKYSYYKGIATLLIKAESDNQKEMINDLISLEYKALEYEETPGIYKLKTVDEAYQSLQLNKGFLYRLHLITENFLSPNQTKYEIEEYKVDPALTKLIYIEPENRDAGIPWTNYLQLYYLFEGTATTAISNKEATFSFLVPALSDSSYKE